MAKRRKSNVQYHEPPIQTQEPPIETPGEYLARMDEELAAMAKKREQVAAQLQEQEAEEQRARDIAEHDARCFWPEDKPLPTRYPKIRRQFQPCPRCRRVLLDSGSQAVVCLHGGEDMVYLKCRACDHTWKMVVCDPPEIREPKVGPSGLHPDLQAAEGV